MGACQNVRTVVSREARDLEARFQEWWEMMGFLFDWRPPHDPNPDPQVTVTMRQSLWHTVNTAMAWDLAELGDMTPHGVAQRAHSERCFAAADIIRRALHIPLVSPHPGCHPR